MKTDGLVGSNATTGRTLRITLTLLSYLSLPFIIFIAFPESLQPLSMLVAAFSAHKVLAFDATPAKAVAVRQTAS